jgi:hypothetical protein
MAFDAHKNFAYGTVLTAPAPALSGTSLVLQAGEGAKFPAVPFNVTVWPSAVAPSVANAEVVRVTLIVGDTLTITRAQEGSAAVAVAIGYQVSNASTKKVFEDIEAATPVISANDPVDPPAANQTLWIKLTGEMWFNNQAGHWAKQI